MRDGAGHLTRSGKPERLPQSLFGALSLVDHDTQKQAGKRERSHERLQLDNGHRNTRLAMDSEHNTDLNDGRGHDRAVQSEPNSDPDKRQEQQIEMA